MIECVFVSGLLHLEIPDCLASRWSRARPHNCQPNPAYDEHRAGGAKAAADEQADKQRADDEDPGAVVLGQGDGTAKKLLHDSNYKSKKAGHT